MHAEKQTFIKSTFSVSHPIHHPSPCAENSTKTNIKSTFSILDPYPQHIRILIRMHSVIYITKTFEISAFSVWEPNIDASYITYE